MTLITIFSVVENDSSGSPVSEVIFVRVFENRFKQGLCTLGSSRASSLRVEKLTSFALFHQV